MEESRQTSAHIHQESQIKQRMFSGKCEIEGCGKEATRLSSKPEGQIIDICDDCWHKLYRS
jgi:hypothetical protein